MSDGYVFAGSPLDRATAQRRDEAWIRSHLEHEESRFLPFWKLNVLVKRETPLALGWARKALLEFVAKNSDPLLLGLLDGVAHFAIDVSGLEKPEAALGVAGAAKFEETRAVAAVLPSGDAAITAQARSLVDWHGKSRFCSVCGGETRSIAGGGHRECDDCDAEHFPRTDPVVIMLVHHAERCLLGRQRGWPDGMFSALAGFVDQGESLEEAVRREVLEEAGIHVGPVSYHSSQPWPFPHSLMIGCLAEAHGDAITVDPHELETARWFERDEIRRALAEPGPQNGFFVPPAMAIAHQIIKAWANGAKA